MFVLVLFWRVLWHRRQGSECGRSCLAQFDPEGFGEIPWPDFVAALSSPEFAQVVGPAKREILTAKAQRSHTTAITFDDFVAVVSLVPRLPQGVVVVVFAAYSLHSESCPRVFFSAAHVVDPSLRSTETVHSVMGRTVLVLKRRNTERAKRRAR